MRKPSYIAALKHAVKAARIDDPTQIGYETIGGTPYRVKVESVHIRPSGGYCRAFGFWYSIIDETGRTVFGAIDRADSFVSLANTWLAFRMMDNQTLDCFIRDGWTDAIVERDTRQAKPTCNLCGSSNLTVDFADHYRNAVTADGKPLMCLDHERKEKE